MRRGRPRVRPRVRSVVGADGWVAASRLILRAGIVLMMGSRCHRMHLTSSCKPHRSLTIRKIRHLLQRVERAAGRRDGNPQGPTQPTGALMVNAGGESIVERMAAHGPA